MTADQFVDGAHSAIKEAIRQFGEYTYFDKGPYEVLDIDTLGEQLLALPAADAADALTRLASDYDGKKFGCQLVTALFVTIQDGPDEWFDEVVPLLSETTLKYFG